MGKDLLAVLQSVGMDDKESQLYLSGLQMGSAPASDYAKATSLNRITAYNTLEELVSKGLFTLMHKSRGKWYSPVSPEQLSLEVRKNAQSLERVVPELRSMQGTSERRPHVRFFEGWDGVRRVYEDTLTAKGEILNFANSTVVRRHWPSYDTEYVAERVGRGIHLRGIAPNDATGRKVQGEDKKMLREIRLVPSSAFDFTNEIKIYDHKVAICSFDSGLQGTSDMFGVIIESREVAETQRQIFEMAWRFAALKNK